MKHGIARVYGMQIALLVLLAAAILALFVYAQDATSPHSGALTVAFLDVGQGDAIFIESPSGTQVLIDGGANTEVLRSLGAVMPWWDHTIDMVLATHSDRDHIGGLPEVLARYDVAYTESPVVRDESPYYAALVRAVDAEHSHKVSLMRGEKVDLGGGAYLLPLFPDRTLPEGVDSNTSSLVAKLVYGDTSFLLTGDSPQAIEEYLVSLDAHILDSDVLKVGHHGSRTSSSNDFIDAVTPAVSIISAGKDNPYGHPHQEVLDRLRAASSTILCTCSVGTIVFESDGREISRVK